MLSKEIMRASGRHRAANLQIACGLCGSGTQSGSARQSSAVVPRDRDVPVPASCAARQLPLHSRET